MRRLNPLVYLIFRSLPALADPDSASMVSSGTLPVITNAIVDTTTHASITDHAAIFQSKLINSDYLRSTITCSTGASPTASIRSPSAQPVMKRAHHDPEQLPKDPPYYTLMLWINGYDVTIPILKDNATEFCKSVMDEAPSETPTLSSTPTEALKSGISPDESEESGFISKSETNSDTLTDSASAKTTPATLTHSRKASRTTGAGSKMDNLGATTALPTKDSLEDTSTSRVSSKKLSPTSEYSHSDTEEDSPSTGSTHEMPASHERTTTQDSSTATWSRATMTSVKYSLPTILSSSLPSGSESGEPSATDKSPDTSQSEGDPQVANLGASIDLVNARLGARADAEVFAVLESTDREEAAENPTDFADTEKPNEIDNAEENIATPISRTHSSVRPKAFVHVREQASQAAHNFQPLAWLRAPLFWRRNFDMSLHDASTPEKVQGWNNVDREEKRRSPYRPDNDHVTGEEEKIRILDHEASPLTKPHDIEEGAEAEEPQTDKPTFGFNPHPRPLPTSPADEENPTTNADADTTDNPLPSSTSHNSFKTHTSPSFPTTTSSAPSHLPQLGITDPVPPQNHTAPTASGNATYSTGEFNGSGKWPNNPFVSPLFWGVGAFYLGFAYWEGWQQARGDVAYPEFVNAGVRWVGEEMVRHL